MNAAPRIFNRITSAAIFILNVEQNELVSTLNVCQYYFREYIRKLASKNSLSLFFVNRTKMGRIAVVLWTRVSCIAINQLARCGHFNNTLYVM